MILSLCRQGLMQAAVGASTEPMAAALRRVLDGFHREKAAPGVDALLLRLYRPILFRALSAANPAVRRNSLGLLLDAFPLQARWNVLLTLRCALHARGILSHRSLPRLLQTDLHRKCRST